MISNAELGRNFIIYRYPGMMTINPCFFTLVSNAKTLNGNTLNRNTCTSTILHYLPDTPDLWCTHAFDPGLDRTIHPDDRLADNPEFPVRGSVTSRICTIPGNPESGQKSRIPRKISCRSSRYVFDPAPGCLLIPSGLAGDSI